MLQNAPAAVVPLRTVADQAPPHSRPAADPPAVPPPAPDRDLFDAWDAAIRLSSARLSGGVSPLAFVSAGIETALHLAASPGRSWKLFAESLRQPIAPVSDSAPPAADARYRDEAWRAWPYAGWAAAHVGVERWAERLLTGVPGLAGAPEALTRFATLQLLDALSPANMPALNPVVAAATLREGGENLRRGLAHWLEDSAAAAAPHKPAANTRLGRDMATSPGAVIRQTPLAEVIQYAPTTATVRPEPVVIVPAWIMKYYVLDLTPESSLVADLTSRGFTVFTLSWKNPGSEDAERSFEDYRREGFEALIDAALAVTGAARAHGVGYCLGGTLLTVGAAEMARRGDDRLASLTLLAAQSDFTEAGPLKLFTGADQLATLEDQMRTDGGLAGERMADAFRWLRSRELVWSRLVSEYALGQRPAPSALQAWNADATRMPFRMHAEYLRAFFRDNDLAEGRFRVQGETVALQDITAPVFAVGAETDTVAPWRSVYKIDHLTGGEVTFLLASGGHNAGIVSPPGHPHRHYRVATRRPGTHHADPDAFLAHAPVCEGSWWPAWEAWLETHSGPPGPPPPLGRPDAGLAPLRPAPGSNVFG